MKYTLSINQLSFIFLGNLLLFFSFICFIRLIFFPNTTVILITFLLVIIGLLLKNQLKYIVFRNNADVIRKLISALKLLKLETVQYSNKIIVTKTKTNIKTYGFLGFTLLSFSLFDRNSNKENYLANTLVKFQMQS